MESNSNSIGNAFAVKQGILEKIESILSNGNNKDTVASDSGTRELFEKKLKSASKKYTIMRPLTITMGVLFTLMCLAQILKIDFFFGSFQWQNATLFIFLTFSLTINVHSLKQQIERYKLLLYLIGMVERLEK